MGGENLIQDKNLITGSLSDVIRRNRQDNQPVFIFGSPGIGKSEQIRAAADKDDIVIDLRLSMLDPVDMRGLPTIKRDKEGNTIRTEWVRPEFLPWDGQGIIFLDELNTAPPSVQNPALQLVLDRRIGPHEIGKDWYICAAGNRSDDRAHVYPLSSALLQRFAVYDYVPDYNTWSEWAIKNNIHETVIGFISFRKELLHEPSVDEYSPGANPRSWSFVSKKMYNNHASLADIRACVGISASEFLAYLDICKNLPDIDKLISGKAKWKEDKSKISISYAISTSVATYLINSKDPAKIIDNCMSVISDISPEPAAIFIRRVVNANSKLRQVMYNSKGVEAWLEKNAELITASADSFQS
jgi:hypothetical protein